MVEQVRLPLTGYFGMSLDSPPTLYWGLSTTIRHHISPIKGTRKVLEHASKVRDRSLCGKLAAQVSFDMAVRIEASWF